MRMFRRKVGFQSTFLNWRLVRFVPSVVEVRDEAQATREEYSKEVVFNATANKYQVCQVPVGEQLCTVSR